MVQQANLLRNLTEMIVVYSFTPLRQSVTRSKTVALMPSVAMFARPIANRLRC